ncbi:hypothetical protein, partial [Mesorhizobium sp. GbtcB19]|uniref:hypothetical protein n=1 Tax=Mesorhizobium sp. GbtcB19 TaxID=2824764 RepID=UPI001C30E821
DVFKPAEHQYNDAIAEHQYIDNPSIYLSIRRKKHRNIYCFNEIDIVPYGCEELIRSQHGKEKRHSLSVA